MLLDQKTEGEKAAEGRRSPRRWRAGRKLPGIPADVAKRRGVRQPSGAFGKEMKKYTTPSFPFRNTTLTGPPLSLARGGVSYPKWCRVF
jgi:hypothetical protein